jgi:hypothetical protein
MNNSIHEATTSGGESSPSSPVRQLVMLAALTMHRGSRIKRS